MVDMPVRLNKSSVFDGWHGGLHDGRARARIEMRLERLGFGNPGDAKSVGGGISEMRVDYGPGYRVYFMRHGPFIVVLLCGGDKPSQRKDIAHAKAIAEQFEE